MYHSQQEFQAIAPILLACSVLSEYNTARSSRHIWYCITTALPEYDWLAYTDSLGGAQVNLNTLLIITHITAGATIFILSKQMNGKVQIQLGKALQLA